MSCISPFLKMENAYDLFILKFKIMYSKEIYIMSIKKYYMYNMQLYKQNTMIYISREISTA